MLYLTFLLKVYSMISFLMEHHWTDLSLNFFIKFAFLPGWQLVSLNNIWKQWDFTLNSCSFLLLLSLRKFMVLTVHVYTCMWMANVLNNFHFILNLSHCTQWDKMAKISSSSWCLTYTSTAELPCTAHTRHSGVLSLFYVYVCVCVWVYFGFPNVFLDNYVSTSWF